MEGTALTAAVEKAKASRQTDFIVRSDESSSYGEPFYTLAGVLVETTTPTL